MDLLEEKLLSIILTLSKYFAAPWNCFDPKLVFFSSKFAKNLAAVNQDN